MAGKSSSDAVQRHDHRPGGFRPFAEDVLQRVITSSKIATYDEVAKEQSPSHLQPL